MKYFSLLSVLLFLFALPVFAQEDVETKTPREQIVQDLELSDAAANIGEDLPVATSNNVILKPKAPKSASKTIQEMFDPISPPERAKKTSPKTPKTIDAIQEVATKPKLKLKKTKSVAAKIAPFYLSAEEYLSLRGDGNSQQTVLRYKVESGAVTGSGLGASQEIALVLGADFVAMNVGKNTTIYDFKLNRILSLKPEYGMDGKLTGKTFFENTSLYAKAYRDITTVRSTTQNGRLKKLDMGKGVSLDAFWIESAMSWATDTSDADLMIEKPNQSLIIKRNGETVFSAEFADEAYDNHASKNALLTFAHVKWPLHPSVLRELYTYASPPKRFEMLSYGPTAPKGQKQVWTLVNQIVETAAFPLPGNAISVAQMPKVTPLVFLIGEAVNNRALGGIKSVKQMASDFDGKLDAEQYWRAWIIGQQYIAYSGKCKNPNDPTICKATAQIEATYKDDMPKRVQDYMTALNAAGRPGLKAEAIETLGPYLDKKETPAFVIRTAAMARAKMKKTQAETAGVTDLNAEILLQTALAKDPYDPNTYVGLAQVLAAKGAFEQSWDIYDALRAGIPTADSIDLKINRLEKNLRKTAPGYFLGE